MAQRWFIAVCVGTTFLLAGCNKGGDSNKNAGPGSQTPIPGATTKPSGQAEVKPKPYPKPTAHRPIDRPVRLAQGGALILYLSSLPKPDREKFVSNVERLKKQGNAEFEFYTSPWIQAVQAATKGEVSESDARAAFSQLYPQLDALWEKDQFQLARINLYINRLKRLPPETCRTWKDELNKLLAPLEASVGDLETVGFVIQLDRLFAGEVFKQDEADALLVRLRSLNPPALKQWGQAIENDAPQVAIMLIQDDTLFNENRFREPAFLEMVRNRKR